MLTNTNFRISDPSDYTESEARAIIMNELRLTKNSGGTWIVNQEFRTDNELATRFVDENNRKMRYVIEWKKWLVWDGKRWQVDSGETILLRLARCFANELWDIFRLIAQSDMDRDEISQCRTFCKSSNKNCGIEAFLNLARADERIAVRVKDLNKYPHLLNLQNGTFDFIAGEFREHNQDELLTQIANVHFDEHAVAQRWIEAIGLIFSNDAELIRYVQQLLGYSLTGDTGEHILPIAYGNGFNGKSFTWNVVLYLLGEYAGLANETLLMGDKNTHPTEKAFLYQKRFVPISEPEQSARLRESRVKELTGDGTITARRMHEDFWSFSRTHTFWLSTNHLPQITGNDDGIWRRVKLIPFVVDLRKVTIPIPDLDKILVESEAAGILNWMIAGYIDYMQHGFVEPECVKAATCDYRAQEDELVTFVAECCVVGPQYIVASKKLYDAYGQWGGKATRIVFGKKMAERFKKDEPTAGEFRKQAIFHGVALASNEQEHDQF